MGQDDPNDTADGGADVDDPVCGAETSTTGDPCQMPVSDPDETCYMHGPDGPPEGHGSGAAESNPIAARHGYEGDNGAPEGNKNALSHGLYAAERDPSGLFDHFRESNPAVAEQIRRWFWSYMDDAPFDAYPGDADRYSPPVLDVVDVDAHERQQDAADDADGLDTVQVSQGPPRQHAAADAPPVDVQALTGKAHRLFIVCVHQAVLTNVTLRQAEEVLSAMEPLTVDGEPIPDGEGGVVEVENELPINLPKARMRQRDLRELKDLGIMDDPESQKADRMGDWAEATRMIAQDDGE